MSYILTSLMAVYIRDSIGEWHGDHKGEPRRLDYSSYIYMRICRRLLKDT